MLKSVLDKGKFIGLALGIFILSQVAPAVTIILVARKVTFNPLGTLMVAALFILVNAGLLFITNRLQWLTWPREGAKKKDFLWIFLSYPMIFVGAMVGAYMLQQQGRTTTVNQALLTEIVQFLPNLIIFFMVVINAPIGEELLCREAVPRIFSKPYRLIGFILGAILFTVLHQPTDLGSWVLYGSMSAIITWVRYRSGKIEVAIGAHMLWNFVSFLLIFVLKVGT